MPHWLNWEIAARLDDVARNLSTRGGSGASEVAAYRHAATVVRDLRRPVSEILHGEGLAGVERVAGVTPTLAAGIRDLVRTGRLPALDRLLEADAVTETAAR